MPFEVHFDCGFGSHLGGLRTGPGPNALDCTPARAGALFYQDPGIQVTAKV